MNSPSVSESAVSAIANRPTALPSRADQQRPSEPFGAILEEATATTPVGRDQTADADTDDCKDAAGPDQKTAPAKEKKKDADTGAAAPLVCFCPPPKIETALPAKNGQDSDPLTLNAESASGPAAAATVTMAEAGAQLPTPTAQTVAQPLAQTVQPKTSGAKSPPKPSRESKDAGAIELGRKLFEPVLPETAGIESAKIISAKNVQAQAPPAANAAHGTLVAQLENHVKNTDKSAEIAPAIEQKMPTRDFLRRAVGELTRVESFQSAKEGSRLLVPDFDASPAEVIPVKSLEAARLVESIRTEVASLRQHGDNAVTVVLRPDSGTQLSIDLSVARDGTIRAVARCDRGDFQSLHTQWPQLQQSLAAHGIRVADLSNQNHPQQNNHRSAGAFQNLDRGENPRQRDQRDGPSFEDQFSASNTKLSPNKPQPQPAKTASATRRWQSWA
jgi:hypothetical protein